jgi:hypothetical protein
VQHAAHLLRRQIDRRIAAVGDDQTVAVAVAFDAAVEFTQQCNTGVRRA